MSTTVLTPNGFSVGGYGGDFSGTGITGTIAIPSGVVALPGSSVDEDVTFSSVNTTKKETISFSPTNNVEPFPTHNLGQTAYNRVLSGGNTLSDITAAAGGNVTFTLTTDAGATVVLNSLALNLTYGQGIPGSPYSQTTGAGGSGWNTTVTFAIPSTPPSITGGNFVIVGETSGGTAGDQYQPQIYTTPTLTALHNIQWTGGNVAIVGDGVKTYTSGSITGVKLTDIQSAAGTTLTCYFDYVGAGTTTGVSLIIYSLYLVLTFAGSFQKKPGLDGMRKSGDAGFNGFRKIIDMGRRWAPGQNYTPPQVWRPGMA